MSETIKAAIELETAKAVSGMKRVDAAVRTTTEAIKQSREAMRKEAAAAREAAAAQKARESAASSLQRQRSTALIAQENARQAAAASLQRQRSAALLAEINRQVRMGEGFELARTRAIHQAADAEERRRRRTAESAEAMRGARVVNRGWANDIVGMVAGFASVSAAGMALREIFQGMRNDAEKGIGFERTMTPLLSLGDNVSKIAQVKTEVLNFSTAWRTNRDVMAPALFDLQSGTANLAQSIRDNLKRESLEMVEVYGGDLPTAMKLTIKGWQTYGSELKTVNDLQNKLAITAEDGFLTFQDMANLLPDVLPAAKTFKYSLDEVLGSLITATQTGGRAEKTFTGLGNVFKRIGDAQSKGIRLTGSFAEQIAQLNKVAEKDPKKLKEIFGDEALSVVSSLAQHSAELAKNIERVASASGDITKGKLFARLQDPGGMAAFGAEVLQQGSENASLQGGGSEFARRFNLGFLSRIRNYRELTPGFMHGSPVEVPGALLGNYLGSDFGSGFRANPATMLPSMLIARLFNREEGVKLAMRDLGAGGRGEEARAFGMHMGITHDASGRSGPEAAAELLRQLSESASGGAKPAIRTDVRDILSSGQSKSDVMNMVASSKDRSFDDLTLDMNKNYGGAALSAFRSGDFAGVAASFGEVKTAADALSPAMVDAAERLGFAADKLGRMTELLESRGRRGDAYVPPQRNAQR